MADAKPVKESGTSDRGLFLRKESPLLFHAYSDSDWAGDPDDRSYTAAYVVFHCCNPVSWSSMKQRIVARSSTEAEYRAIASTTTELCWVRNILNELAVTPAKIPIIYYDNLGATYVCSNPVFHSRMKHIELDYHFIRKLVQQGILRVSHVSSKDQLADMLTKPLPSGSFDLLRSNIDISG
uniref:Reverse transcriptase Ty1/copia-type domain-containing protein n=1 Tax=Solanum lycopersicum TaxID=4081 RepID=A0A3Q7J889_SOLLC